MLESIFETGNLLEAAKDELRETVGYGEWRKMVRNELPFTKRTADRLIVIATNDNLRDETHGSHLPAHWRTLDELTKLTDEQFAKGIQSGAINPNMQRKAVARQMVDSGMSRREAAKALGVHHSTVQADLGEKSAKNGGKSATPPEEMPTEEEAEESSQNDVFEHACLSASRTWRAVWICFGSRPRSSALARVSFLKTLPRQTSPRRCHHMPREPKATTEIIAEMTNEIITLCGRLPDRHLAEIAQQMFREAAAQATRAAESKPHQRAG